VEVEVKDGCSYQEEEEIPGSYGGIVGEFGRLYVKTEKIDKKIGRGLNRALELRNKARYDFKIQISEEQTKGVIELAGKLKEFLSERVRKWKKL